MSTALNATPEGSNDPETTNEEDDKTLQEGTVIKKKAPEPAEDDKNQVKLTNYSWIVLGCICAVRICYQWMRAIFSYSYGYTGVGE